jgi:hypothetical protein
VLEDNYYHPNIVRIVSTLRREIRCDNEADQFIQRANYRSKVTTLFLWKEYRRRRDLCRRVAVDLFVHWCHAKQSVFFDHWKKIILVEKYTETIQRYGRGLIGRLRRNLMRRLNFNSLKLQSFTRKHHAMKRYSQRLSRHHWAATMIQKSYRGMGARRRVQHMVEAVYDLGVRELRRERQRYHAERNDRAAHRIQNLVKKFLKKMRAYWKRKKILEVQRVEQEIVYHKKDNLRRQREYRIELEEWFRKRKEEYDHDRMLETHTAEERSKIIAYRRRMELYEKEKREELRREKHEKLEEQFIEQWNQMWEKKKIDRSKAHMAECRHCILNPETPDQRLKKKALELRVKKRIPEVLKKADRMRIPMEIPEAKEIALEDVIEMEGKEEVERVEKEMYEAALLAEQAKEEKRLEDERIEKNRRERQKHWAIVKIQTQARMMFSRRHLREKAYTRYRKEFDPHTKAYYYIDLQTNQTAWEKPKSLGLYDIDTKDHWVVLVDAEGEPYYYNPRTWKMTWTPPKGTIFCKVCHQNGFAVSRLENNKQFYCETHLAEMANQLLAQHTLPQDIKFKSFDCSVVGSVKTYWASLPTENWLVHCLQLNDKLVRQQSMNQKYLEDELTTFDHETAEAEAEGVFGAEHEDDVIHNCKRCETYVAERKCLNCEEYYCRKCYDRKHKMAPWATHTYREIVVESGVFGSPTRGETEP